MPPPFITRVRIKNYKSIGYCDVELQALTFLVGPNGGGKSNFLDAIRFVSDGLRNSLEFAILERGGISQVVSWSAGDLASFSIRLDFQVSASQAGFYTFEIGALRNGNFTVLREQCYLRTPPGSSGFRVEEGQVLSITADIAPPAIADRLFLVNAAGLPEFRPIYDALSQMVFYNLNPERMRMMQKLGQGDVLLHDGSNDASVFGQMSKQDPAIKRRLVKFLASIVPGIVGAELVQAEQFGSVGFQQRFLDSSNPWRVHSMTASDGTIRAFGILIALHQFGLTPATSRKLIGIEEPEIGLHPGAAGVLFDAIQDTSQRLQVIITSHSPELLEDKSLQVESILAVVSENGETQIGPIEKIGREILRDNLATAGELLRAGQITPDPHDFEHLRSEQHDFFEAPEK